MLFIRVAEIDLIHVWLQILGNSSLECIASKKLATLSSWHFRRSAMKSPSSTIIFFFEYFLKVLNFTEFHWRMMVNAPYDHVIFQHYWFQHFYEHWFKFFRLINLWIFSYFVINSLFYVEHSSTITGLSWGLLNIITWHRYRVERVSV